MFTKIKSLCHALDTLMADLLADTLQHIGLDLLSKGDHPMAIKWLKRAREAISSPDLERLSITALESRLTILQALVAALLGAGSQEATQEAGGLVDHVELEMGGKPIVLRWRLEWLQNAPAEEFDTHAYDRILRCMIRAFDFSEETFQHLLHYMLHLHGKSPALATALLDEFFMQRLVQSTRQPWIGKAVVRRIWMTTSNASSAHQEVDQLQQTITHIFQR